MNHLLYTGAKAPYWVKEGLDARGSWRLGLTTQHTVGGSMYVALLQTCKGCTEREEEGEEREEKHQHLESGYSSTESSLCLDYLLIQVIGACLYCMAICLILLNR